MFYVVVLRKRSSPAQIAYGPTSVLHQGCLVCLRDHLDQIVESSCPYDTVPVEDTVTTDVPQSPNSLLDNTSIRRPKEVNKEGYAAFIDYTLALNSGPRCNIGERPGSFELELGVLLLLNVINHPWD